jgi:nicotinate-nucleotide adenylyltransferase
MRPMPGVPRMTPRRIGLLGGSFNPAHAGHLHISREALRRLGLDEVWWVVSPQNPLKGHDDMAALERRLAGARAAADDPRLRVEAPEVALGTRYTVDTVAALRRCYPMARFVWLMGADILPQLPRWKNWQRLFRQVPIAVFDRPGDRFRALAGPAARRFADARLFTDLQRLPALPPPAWCFIRCPLDTHSATAIRAARKSA